MKKHLILALVSVILLSSVLLFPSCVIGNNNPDKTTIVFDGETYQYDGALFEKDRARLPLIYVLEHTGFRIEWTDDEHCTVFSQSGTEYLISLTQLSFIRKDDPDLGDFMLIPPGTEDGCIMGRGKEVFVDPETLTKSIFPHLETEISVAVDVSGKIITISRG